MRSLSVEKGTRNCELARSLQVITSQKRGTQSAEEAGKEQPGRWEEKPEVWCLGDNQGKLSRWYDQLLLLHRNGCWDVTTGWGRVTGDLPGAVSWQPWGLQSDQRGLNMGRRTTLIRLQQTFLVLLQQKAKTNMTTQNTQTRKELLLWLREMGLQGFQKVFVCLWKCPEKGKNVMIQWEEEVLK